MLKRRLKKTIYTRNYGNSIWRTRPWRGDNNTVLLSDNVYFYRCYRIYSFRYGRITGWSVRWSTLRIVGIIRVYTFVIRHLIISDHLFNSVVRFDRVLAFEKWQNKRFIDKRTVRVEWAREERSAQWVVDRP